MTRRKQADESNDATEPQVDDQSVSRRRFATGLAGLGSAIAAGSVLGADPANAATLDRHGRLGIGTEPDAPLHVEGDYEAIVGHSGKFGVQGAGTVGVHGEALGPGTIGVYGFAAEPGSRAYAGGAHAPGSYGMQLGVAGHHSTGVYSESGAADSTAVHGVAHDARSHGVHGAAYGRHSAGVFAEAVDDAHALWADGQTHLNGAASHSGAGFRIDHPTDPANRYLTHSVVESHERKTVYDGVVELDKNGHARVELPKWFCHLNSDVRYQLTAIGAAMPRLHVSRPIQNNVFHVAGGVAGAHVSWQVTGVRQDAWAACNRLEVEERKSAADSGRMLHPDVQPGRHAAVRPRPAAATRTDKTA